MGSGEEDRGVQVERGLGEPGKEDRGMVGEEGRETGDTDSEKEEMEREEQ